MPIPNYTHPQTRLFQFLQTLNAATGQILYPLIVGPQYLLSRYGVEDTPLIDFAAASADQLIPFERSVDGVSTALTSSQVADLDFTRLFGKALEATLATFAYDGTPHFTVVGPLETSVIEISANTLSGGTLATALRGRAVAVGDIVYVTTGGKTYRRKVVGLRGTTIAADFGADSPGSNGKAGGSDYNPATRASSVVANLAVPTGMSLDDSIVVTNPDDFQGTVLGALYANSLGEEFTLTVTTAGDTSTAVVTVTSKSGLYSGTIASVDDTGDYQFTGGAGVTGGLIITLIGAEVGAALVLGDVYKFSVKTPYTRLTDTLSTGQVVVSLKSGATAYAHDKNTTYIVEVITGTYNNASPTATGAVVRITDSSAIDATAEVNVTDNTLFDLGTSDLQMKFHLASNGTIPQGGLRKGDVYFVNCVAETESATEFNKAVLDGPAVDSTTFTDYAVGVAVEFRVDFTGEIKVTDAADEVAWTASSSGVTVQEGLSLYVDARSANYKWCPFVDSIGELALYFRALVQPASTEGRIVISDVADIPSLLGTIDLDNDVAYGAYEALRGGPGLISVAVLRTRGTALEDFTTALTKVENTKLVYAIAPMTQDFEIASLVATHASNMSGPTRKHFRRCYIGIDSPGEYSVLTSVNSSPVTCTVGDYGGENLLVTIITEGVDLTTLGLVEGDLVKFPVLDVEYPFASLLSETELLLSSGPATPISPAATVELWKADSAQSQGAYVRARARTLANRRASVIWTENGTKLIGDNVRIIPNRYQAAHIAGLRCAMLPQQGQTRTDVTSISDAPAMYTRYTNDDLDAIAADGVWIITQQSEGGPCFTRHQLTTGIAGGALAYEDNVGVIVDFLSFATDTIVDGYIGKFNVTTATLIDMRNALADLFNGLTQTDYGEDAGPMLVRFESLKIIPDRVLKDRVKILVTWIVPLPFNQGDVYVNVDQDVTLPSVIA